MSKVFLKKVGNRIKNLRQDNGLSQEKLAEKVGLSRNAIGSIERAECATSIDILYKIFKVLNVDLAKYFIE